MNEHMREEQKSTYLAWLKDAHAMELGLVSVLQKQIEDFKDEPMVVSKLSEHLEQTKKHAELVEECIERNGGKPSMVKDWGSKLSAAMQGMGMSFNEDVKVKDAHSAYAAEQFEIATYTLIAAAAEEFGDEETIDAVSSIMEEEIDMANWLMDNLPVVAQKHLLEV
jgi:ferritin-like metal-binding protein YciE